jgi:Fe-S-cluster containining protein
MPNTRKKKESWWHGGVKFSCQGSGKCCVSRGSYGYVYLTLDDRRALARHLGLATGAFTRKYCEREGGIWKLRDFNEECRFLEGKSCGVYEARPTQCRTWPFWPENMSGKAWSREVAAYCPGVGRGRVIPREEIEVALASQKKSEAQYGS